MVLTVNKFIIGVVILAMTCMVSTPGPTPEQFFKNLKIDEVAEIVEKQIAEEIVTNGEWAEEDFTPPEEVIRQEIEKQIDALAKKQGAMKVWYRDSCEEQFKEATEKVFDKINPSAIDEMVKNMIMESNPHWGRSGRPSWWPKGWL